MTTPSFRLPLRNPCKSRVTNLKPNSFNVSVISAAVFAAIQKEGIAGYSQQDFIAYYLLTMVSRAFSSMPGLASGIAGQIRKGEVKKFLIQPIDMIGFLFSQRLAHKVVYYTVATIPFAVVFWICRDYFSGWPDGVTLAAFAASLGAPLEFRRISSNFGGRRHPVLGIFRRHQGTDYAASSGTQVRAIGDGMVISAGVRGGYGNVIDVRHTNGIVTRYGHLRGFAKGVRAGTRVAMGQTIGYVGMTGLTPEQRFENHKNGKKSARIVRRCGERLVPKLYAHLNPMTFDEAAAMELQLAEELRARGFRVYGGH